MKVNLERSPATPVRAARLGRSGSRSSKRRRVAASPGGIRVGTHALKAGSSTKLLTACRSTRARPGTGSGNHRGSIFRLIVGAALSHRNGYNLPTWGKGNTASREVTLGERVLECG